MSFLSHLDDLSTPRLTVYNEVDGSRLDFSGATLDNWASKVANMLRDEYDLEPGDSVGMLLPNGWAYAVIALGALKAGMYIVDQPQALTFISAQQVDTFSSDDAEMVAVISDHPLGLGVTETGGSLPQWAEDFFPLVRTYPDHYPHACQPLPDLVGTTNDCPGRRVLSCGWSDAATFRDVIILPIAAGGSAVTVLSDGEVSEQRLRHIREAEKC